MHQRLVVAMQIEHDIRIVSEPGEFEPQPREFAAWRQRGQLLRHRRPHRRDIGLRIGAEPGLDRLDEADEEVEPAAD